MSPYGQVRGLLAVFVGLWLLGLGSSLLASLVGLRLSAGPFPDFLIGVIAASFAAGGVIGANVCADIVLRVGHIRSFAAFSALLACVTLVHTLTDSPAVWMPLRIASGFCYYGLLVVAESWLNQKVDRTSRGRVLAIYMIVFFASAGAGQLLLNFDSPAGYVLFVISAMLFALAVVPVSLIRSAEPVEIPTDRLKIARLWEISPLAVTGAFCAGVIMGVYYALGAVVADRIGFSTAEVSILMASVIAGGLAFQWPIGWLSDRVDRTWVISAVALAASVITLVAFLLAREATPLLYIVAFLFGGAAFSLYPLNLAQANDFIGHGDVVGVSRGLLTVLASGAVLGPAAGGLLIQQFDARAIFLELAAAGAVLTVVAVFARGLPQPLRSAYVSVPVSTLGASELDPRRHRSWIREHGGEERRPEGPAEKAA